MLTRQGNKNRNKNQRSLDDSGTQMCSRRSVSSSSTDQFELLEKKLLQSLGQIISDKLKEFEERISAKIEAALNVVQSEVAVLGNEVETLKGELLVVRRELDEIHRASRLTDAVVIGIPTLPDEEPNQILSTISNKIGHSLSPYSNAFRPRNAPRTKASHRKNVPLILKFSCSAEQREFLLKFKRFGQIKLNDVSSKFSSTAKIAAFESLTSNNNKILRSGLRLKRENLIHSIFTKRGEIFVCLRKDDPAIKIPSLSYLKDVIAKDGSGAVKSSNCLED